MSTLPAYLLTYPPGCRPACLQIEISAKRNEIIDECSLIARYQQEIALLKRQLEVVMQERKWLHLSGAGRTGRLELVLSGFRWPGRN